MFKIFIFPVGGAVQLTQLVSDRINKIYRVEKTSAKAEKVKNIKKHAQNVSQGYNTNNCSQQTLQDKSSETRLIFLFIL